MVLYWTDLSLDRIAFPIETPGTCPFNIHDLSTYLSNCSNKKSL